MTLNFEGYTYIGVTDPSKNTKEDYAFDNIYFNKLINAKRYTDAANYAKQYKPTDPAEQKQHNLDIIDLERQGKKLEAIYTSVGMDKSKQEALEFKDAIFTPGGIDSLKGTNNIANSFIYFKESLGNAYAKPKPGYNDNKHNLDRGLTNKATRLEFSFAPEKQTFIGDNWLGDALARDNATNLDNFLKQSGYTEDMLKKAGVKVERNKNGYGFITFDKNIDISNELLYKLYKFGNVGSANSNAAFQRGLFSWDRTILLRSYGADGKELTGYIETGQFDKIGKLIDGTNDSATRIIDDLKYNKNYLKNYSSTKMSLANDDLIELEEAYARGEVTPSQYSNLRRRYIGELDHFVKTLADKDIVYYTDYDLDHNNKLYEDRSLHVAAQEYNKDITQMLSEANTNRLHYDVQISHGKIGLLVTVDGEEATKSKDASDRKQIWIPMDERYGSLYGKLQRTLDSDTYSRAAQELNEMQDWGYAYNTTDGHKIIAKEGKFYVDNQEIDKNLAVRFINKNKIMEDVTSTLKYRFMNEDGRIINEDLFHSESMKCAIAAANELSPEVPLAHLDGKPLTLDEIVTNTENLTRAREEENYALYRKLSEIYEMYNRIIASANQ